MRVAFLDRDGVINRYPGNKKYVTSWKKFHFLPGVKSSLKRLNGHGVRICIISNQAGVSKGIYSRKTLEGITANMLEGLKPAHIEGVYYCTHRNEDNCSCRKPKAGLVESAIKELKEKGLTVNRKQSFFVGDTLRDIKTGKRAGLRTILVFSGKEKLSSSDNWDILADFYADNLREAVDIILKK